MKKVKITSVGILVVLIALILAVQSGQIFGPSAAASDSEMKHYTATFLDIFDTKTDIVGYATNEEDFTNQANAIKDRLVYYNNLYDIYNDYEGVNNIKTINDHAGESPVEVDDAIIELLLYSKDMYALTEGRVNVAMGSVLSIWHEYREYGSENPEDATLPKLPELQAAAEHTSIEDVIIDEAAHTVYLADPDMSLDVGSIAKGYACQRVMDECRAKGMDHVLLSLGGNISGIGMRYDGSNFRVAIQNPDMESEEQYIEKVDLQDGQCVVSSGDYQRYYVVDGKVYCHIINPDTLFPADNFAAVSIITKDSAMADALSTALYNMTLEEGQTFIAGLEDVEAMWVYHDGTKVYSEHFEESTVK